MYVHDINLQIDKYKCFLFIHVFVLNIKYTNSYKKFNQSDINNTQNILV